ncbi:MAG: hypothetical protein JWR83_3264, partial [Aeromicrobium sp.]|nr:hypothetical protein [Aeromicrobium sp.]
VYPHSIKAAGGGSITYKLGKACTAFTSVVGMDDTSSSGATGYAAAEVTYENGGGSLFGFEPVAVGNFGTYVTEETKLTNALYVQFHGASADNSQVVDYGTPQVYCAS